MTSQFAKDNYETEELDTALKKRLWSLMTEEEKKMPYKFANRVGLGKSTFHTIWTKSATSIHKKTAEKIAEATSTDADWIQTGEPPSIRPIGFDDGTRPINIDNTPLLRPQKLMDAMEIVEDVLKDTGKTMNPTNKAEFVMRVYELLTMNPEPTEEYKETLKLTLKLA